MILFLWKVNMIVYRLSNKNEVDEILSNKNFNNVGSFFEIDKKKNNHKYNSNKKYLHFFRDKYSLLFLNMKKGEFICTYNIPDDILKEKSGYGAYLNFVTFKEVVPVPEFAVESELITFDYLVKIDKIIKDIEHEDFLFNEKLTNLIDNIYNKDNENQNEQIL